MVIPSVSPPITISSATLRIRVEKHLGRPVDDGIWRCSEEYARMKLDHCRFHEPEEEYFDNEYLVLLTADTVRETEFSEFTKVDCALKLERLRDLLEIQRECAEWD